jgi:hypothetical protein
MSVTELDEARREAGIDTEDALRSGGEDTASAAEMAGGEGEGEQEELFPLGSVAGDPRTTWKTLIKPRTPVKTECKLSQAAVPLTDGLYDFGEKGEVLVTFEAGQVRSVPELGEPEADGQRKLKGVKLVQNLRSIHVRDGSDMFTREQVVELLDAAGATSAQITELLDG